MKEHIAFPSISGFANTIKYRDRFQRDLKQAYFATKIKLHGTNAAVRISDGEIIAQSRKRDLSLGRDNYGFADWVNKNKEYFEGFLNSEMTIVIYGEWAGQGVQKSVAVSQLPKAFYIFAIAFIDSEGEKTYVVDPVEIEAYVNEQDDMFILPWFSQNHLVDFNNPQLVADFMNEAVAGIDEVDPYIFKKFGVKGIGEGLVGYCTDHPSNTALWFKVKGASHTVNDEAKIAKVSKRAGKEYHDLAEAFLTEGRFKQAMFELDIDFDRKYTGKFIGWVCKDIQKESENERRELDIDWRLWSGILAKGARDWFLERT